MKKFSYLIIALLLSSCVTTRVVMPEYQGTKIPGKSMGIIAENINVKCPKDVNDDLGEGDPEIVFGEYFEYLFSRNIREKSNLSALVYNPNADTSSFTKRSFEINKDLFVEMNMPQDSTIIKTKPAYFDYILILDELNIDKVSEINYSTSLKTTGSAAGGLSRKTSLKFIYKYFIWDNGKKQVIAYGAETIANDYSIVLTKKKWDATVEKMAKNILENTPFDGSKLKKERF